jgi:hypothetical protein
MLERDAAADRRMADTGSLLAYLPRIVLYPLRGHALGALLLFTVCLWFGLQSVMGIALLAIAAPWVFHYAEAVIDQTANGQATPPRFGGDMIFLGSQWSAFRPLVGVTVIAGGWLLVRDYGAGAQLAVLVAGAVLFPAFMLVLTVRNSIVAALNPLLLLATMAGVGRVYLAICAILSAAAATIVYTANQALQFGLLFVAIYLLLMTFHLLGYVAFHRAEQIGLHETGGATTDFSRRMEEQAARLAVVLRNVDAALGAGNLDGAARALSADPGGPADVRLFHEELFEQMQRRRKVELIHLQGQRLITRLLWEKRAERALDAVETCFDAHRDFTPEHSAQAVTLAAAALKARRLGLFERLTHDAATRHAGTPTAASLLFLTAQYHCDVRRDEARAKEILKPLLAQTAHPQHRQFAAYAKALGV